MQLSGQKEIAAARQTVYDALNDAAILKNSIPGCERLEKKSDTEFAAVARVKIGPVSASFSGEVTLSDLNPPAGYTISGKGSGGVAGVAKGSATVTLVESGNKTLLRYDARAQVGGKIAQLGARLIDGAAKKLADEFFERFCAQLQPEEPAAAKAEMPAPPAPAKKRGRIAAIALAAAAVIAVAALAVFI